MKLLIVQLHPAPRYFLPLAPNILLTTLLLNNVNLFLNVTDQVFTNIQHTCQSPSILLSAILLTTLLH